jgi:hypothetical protein
MDYVIVVGIISLSGCNKAGRETEMKEVGDDLSEWGFKCIFSWVCVCVRVRMVQLHIVRFGYYYTQRCCSL